MKKNCWKNNILFFISSLANIKVVFTETKYLVFGKTTQFSQNEISRLWQLKGEFNFSILVPLEIVSFLVTIIRGP